MRETKRDERLAAVRDRSAPEVEVRAALCHVVRTCGRHGVERLREVVLGEEPVFYVDR